MANGGTSVANGTVNDRLATPGQEPAENAFIKAKNVIKWVVIALGTFVLANSVLVAVGGGGEAPPSIDVGGLGTLSPSVTSVIVLALAVFFVLYVRYQEQELTEIRAALRANQEALAQSLEMTRHAADAAVAAAASFSSPERSSGPPVDWSASNGALAGLDEWSHPESNEVVNRHRRKGRVGDGGSPADPGVSGADADVKQALDEVADPEDNSEVLVANARLQRAAAKAAEAETRRLVQRKAGAGKGGAATPPDAVSRESSRSSSSGTATSVSTLVGSAVAGGRDADDIDDDDDGTDRTSHPPSRPVANTSTTIGKRSAPESTGRKARVSFNSEVLSWDSSLEAWDMEDLSEMALTNLREKRKPKHSILREHSGGSSRTSTTNTTPSTSSTTTTTTGLAPPSSTVDGDDATANTAGNGDGLGEVGISVNVIHPTLNGDDDDRIIVDQDGNVIQHGEVVRQARRVSTSDMAGVLGGGGGGGGTNTLTPDPSVVGPAVRSAPFESVMSPNGAAGDDFSTDGSQHNAGEPLEPRLDCEVVAGSATGSAFSIFGKDVAIIGRPNPTANIHIQDQTVSHNHCKVTYDPVGAKFYIEDSGSTHGTYVQSCAVAMASGSTSTASAPGTSSSSAAAAAAADAADTTAVAAGATANAWIFLGSRARKLKVRYELSLGMTVKCGDAQFMVRNVAVPPRVGGGASGDSSGGDEESEEGSRSLFRITVVHGVDMGKSRIVRPPGCRVGRARPGAEDDAQQFLIRDPTKLISSNHAELYWDAQTAAMMVRDTSTNGTFLAPAGGDAWERLAKYTARPVNEGDFVRFATGAIVRICARDAASDGAAPVPEALLQGGGGAGSSGRPRGGFPPVLPARGGGGGGGNNNSDSSATGVAPASHLAATGGEAERKRIEKIDAMVEALEGVQGRDARDHHHEIPDEFLCPITKEIMRDPVMVAKEGHTYERAQIERWFEDHDTGPKTGLRLEKKDIIPNFGLRDAISTWLSRILREDGVSIGSDDSSANGDNSLTAEGSLTAVAALAGGEEKRGDHGNGNGEQLSTTAPALSLSPSLLMAPVEAGDDPEGDRTATLNYELLDGGAGDGPDGGVAPSEGSTAGSLPGRPTVAIASPATAEAAAVASSTAVPNGSASPILTPGMEAVVSQVSSPAGGAGVEAGV